MSIETLEEFERRRHCSHTNATDEEVYHLTKERDEARAALSKEKETHKKVMKHWLETNNKMLKKANDYYKGIEEENKKYKTALEDISTLRKSNHGDYPVMLSDGEMFHIAKRAIE